MRRVSAVLSVKRNWTTMPRGEDVGMNYSIGMCGGGGNERGELSYAKV
jgi:hypothetical protein